MVAYLSVIHAKPASIQQCQLNMSQTHISPPVLSLSQGPTTRARYSHEYSSYSQFPLRPDHCTDTKQRCAITNLWLASNWWWTLFPIIVSALSLAATILLYCKFCTLSAYVAVISQAKTVFMRSYIVSLGAVQGTRQWHLLLLG